MKIDLRPGFKCIFLVMLLAACQPVTAKLDTKAAPNVVNTPAPVYTGMPLEPQGFIQHTHDPVIAHEADIYDVHSTNGQPHPIHRFQ